MKAGIVVLCRFNSSRLPGKILAEIDGKPLLTYILERLKLSKFSKQIIIATSEESSDDPIANFCTENGYKYFRGSLQNVAERFLCAAESEKLDYAVRVNGDNIFADPGIIDQAIETAISGSFDFVSNVKSRTYPTGMSVEVVKTSFYRRSLVKFNEARFIEHVTLFFYENENEGDFYFFINHGFTEAHGFKLAVDCQADLDFVSLLLRKMGDHTKYDWKQIVELARNERL